MGQEALKAIPCNCADEEPAEGGGKRTINDAATPQNQKNQNQAEEPTEKPTQAEIMPTQAEIIGMKKQFKQRMVNLMAIAKESPFQNVSADIAIDHYSKIAARNPDKKLDKASFQAATSLLASQNQIQVDKTQIEKIFTTLDCDENGALSCAEWASGIPLFFGGSGVEIDRAVFKQLDADGSGTLDLPELQKYCAPIISMMVPFGKADLRMSMQKRLATVVFKAIDRDHNGKLTPEEFIAWCEHNNLGQSAIQCLG